MRYPLFIMVIFSFFSVEAMDDGEKPKSFLPAPSYYQQLFQNTDLSFNAKEAGRSILRLSPYVIGYYSLFKLFKTPSHLSIKAGGIAALFIASSLSPHISDRMIGAPGRHGISFGMSLYKIFCDFYKVGQKIYELEVKKDKEESSEYDFLFTLSLLLYLQGR